MENVLPYHDGFRRLATGAPLRGACGQLLGESAVLFKDKIIPRRGDGFKRTRPTPAGGIPFTSRRPDRATIANAASKLHQLRQLSVGTTTDAQLSPAPFPPSRRAGDAVSSIPSSAPLGAERPAGTACSITMQKAGGHHLAVLRDKRASYLPDMSARPANRTAVGV
jgi:hypothetical protein